MMSLPFLEAMLPKFASAATSIPRLVMMYGGAPVPLGRSNIPYGALGTSIDPALNSLVSVRQYVTLISGLALPIYTKGTTPPPGGCVQQQHGCAAAPFLAGMPSYDSKPMMNQCHTVDQIFADALGGGTKFKSIQARVQAVGYGGGPAGGIVSARYDKGVLSTLSPVVSPLDLYTKLFSGGVPGGPVVPPTPAVSAQLLNRRSVIDLVLGDANRLISSLSGTDKVRMEQHFDELREIEKQITASMGTGTPQPPPVASSSCAKPSAPVDPALGANSFAGWSSETVRGDLQADLLAMALACDLTRSISWQITFDQCFLGSSNVSGVNEDFHAISHGQTAAHTTALQVNSNWHAARFARLVSKLASLQDGNGSVLDSTFLAMGFGEGNGAHNRQSMAVYIAGCPSKIKLGQHIAGNGEHSAKVWISGLNALGLNTNQLGQITGPLASILK